VNTAGFNGTISLDPPLTIDADGAKALDEGRLYVNVHTKAHDGGEIRGQIYKEGSADTCPKGGAGSGDGGATDGGASSSGGTTDDGGTSGGGSGDDGGCSSAGVGKGSSNGSNGLILAAGLAIAVGAVSRRSRRAKER
jgi:hypothetical protein